MYTCTDQTLSEKGEVLLRGLGTLRLFLKSSGKTLPVKCPSVQWQPHGLTIHTEKWFPGAGFLGAPPISLNQTLQRDREPVFLAVCSKSCSGCRPSILVNRPWFLVPRRRRREQRDTFIRISLRFFDRFMV